MDPIIGTAGWSIARDVASAFAGEGSALSRYASVFGGVEVNSSFYRRHRAETWQRWRDSVPEHFRFAVKLPKTITHEQRLADVADELDLFAADVAPLGEKLGPVLVQLPPTLAFDRERDARFFEQLCARLRGRMVIEPRHASWATGEALALIGQYGVTLVEADPQLLAAAPSPDAFRYLRLHGTPKLYYSEYDAARLTAFAEALKNAAPGSWCIFDNTASGAALRNALALHEMLGAKNRSNASDSASGS